MAKPALSDCVVCVVCVSLWLYSEFRAIPTPDNAHRRTVLFGGLGDQK